MQFAKTASDTENPFAFILNSNTYAGVERKKNNTRTNGNILCQQKYYSNALATIIKLFT